VILEIKLAGNWGLKGGMFMTHRAVGNVLFEKQKSILDWEVILKEEKTIGGNAPSVRHN